MSVKMLMDKTPLQAYTETSVALANQLKKRKDRGDETLTKEELDFISAFERYLEIAFAERVTEKKEEQSGVYKDKEKQYKQALTEIESMASFVMGHEANAVLTKIRLFAKRTLKDNDI